MEMKIKRKHEEVEEDKEESKRRRISFDEDMIDSKQVREKQGREESSNKIYKRKEKARVMAKRIGT